jgi:hypothetical protein
MRKKRVSTFPVQAGEEVLSSGYGVSYGMVLSLPESTNFCQTDES